MNTNDKELLLKDLSARLPYGMFAHYILFDEYHLIGRVYLWTDECFYIKRTDKYSDNWTWNYETCTSCAEFDKFKPYLRPMSSMNEEEIRIEREIQQDCLFGRKPLIILTDFYYSRNLDVNGLIEKGLALSAPEGMYNI